MSRGTGRAVENTLIVLLAFVLPPYAVALVTGFGIHFAVNLALTFLGAWVAGIAHAAVLVAIVGLREKELLRARRQDRPLRAAPLGTRAGGGSGSGSGSGGTAPPRRPAAPLLYAQKAGLQKKTG